MGYKHRGFWKPADTFKERADLDAGYAREIGLETVGFLMLSHMIPPEELAKQARIMVDAGCQCPYVTDSAGALLMHQARERFEALVAEVGDEAGGVGVGVPVRAPDKPATGAERALAAGRRRGHSEHGLAVQPTRRRGAHRTPLCGPAAPCVPGDRVHPRQVT